MPDQASGPKVITLPEHDDMLARLKTVDDDPYKVESFYPILLRNAGAEKVGIGVVLMLQLAIYDFTKGLPFGASLMEHQVRPYIDALIDDEEVKADAFALMDKAEAEAGLNS